MGIDILKIATALDHAAVDRKPIDSLRVGSDLYDLAGAYKIQDASIALREQRGEKRVGMKLGFTSRAKMAQMGVDHLIWGVITDEMRLEEGGVVDLSRFIHPRIEPEIAFVTNQDISSTLTLAQARLALAGIAPAMEIIDSRYNQFKFTLEEVVADNASSAGFVIGDLVDAQNNIDNCGVVLSVDGEVIEIGSSAAILGKPLRALVQISALLAASGQVLPAGSIILAGAATAAVVLQRGQYVETRIQGLGSVSVKTM